MLAPRIVTKVLPSNPSYKSTLAACERSLNRLGGAVVDVARRLGRTPRQVVRNVLTRRPSLFAIPKATRSELVRENAAALGFTLSHKDLSATDAEHRR